jgi:hypothetical protein
MAFDEDLTAFLDLDGFGVPVAAGAVSGVGILSLESELGVGGEITFIGCTVTVPTATFGGLSNGNAIAVDGVSYKVAMQPQRFDGGAFCRVPLIPSTTAVVIPLAGRTFRTGSGLVLRSGAGRSLQAQPA